MSTRTRRDAITQQVLDRARDYARNDRGWTLPGVGKRHLDRAWNELSPEEKAVERGLAPPPVSTPEGDASYLLRQFMAGGMSREAAEQRLKESHPNTYRIYSFSTQPTAREALHTEMQRLMQTYGVRASIAMTVARAMAPGLTEAVANLPDGGATAQVERERFAKLTSAHPARSYAGGPQAQNPWHVILNKLTREELLNLLVAEKLSTGDATEWLLATVMGKKPLGLSPQASQAWDQKLADEVKRLVDEAELIRLRQKGRTA